MSPGIFASAGLDLSESSSEDECDERLPRTPPHPLSVRASASSRPTFQLQEVSSTSDFCFPSASQPDSSAAALSSLVTSSTKDTDTFVWVTEVDEEGDVVGKGPHTPGATPLHGRTAPPHSLSTPVSRVRHLSSGDDFHISSNTCTFDDVRSTSHSPATSSSPSTSNSSSPASSGTSSCPVKEWEGGFVTEAILEHKRYEECYEAQMRGAHYAPFLPECRLRAEHSVHVFLVHWKGFGPEEDTWEPEENLEDNWLLLDYKRRHGLPPHRETFRRIFSWNPMDFRPTTLSAADIISSGKRKASVGDNDKRVTKRGRRQKKKRSTAEAAPSTLRIACPSLLDAEPIEPHRGRRRK